MKTSSMIAVNLITFSTLALIACNDTTKLLNNELQSENTTQNNQLKSISENIENELQTREKLKFKILQLFQDQKFEELDQLALRYQNNNERTKSGLWKLTIFYDAFNAYEHVKDEVFWQYYFDTVDKWVALTDSSTAHLVKAQLYRSYAWSIRGGGYASSVPKEAWKPFKKNLAIANDYLDSHKEVAAANPQWYTVKLDILTGLGKDVDTVNQVFNEGVTKFPYYYQIYFNALRYLTPKWHGDAQKIEVFANKAVDITQDIEGMGMYARIYWSASQEQYDERLFYQSDVVWKKMRQGIFDVLDKYPDQWNIQNFAYFSCLANDKKTTRKLMKQVQKPIIMEAWKNENVYNKCKNL